MSFYFDLTVSPSLKTSSVRKSDNILRTDAPWGRKNKKHILHVARTFCSGVVQARKCEATLLYEMASNSSLICSGLWMSSSLEDSGWEEAKASMANTRWTSFSTMRSFCRGTFEKLLTKAPKGIATMCCHCTFLAACFAKDILTTPQSCSALSAPRYST